MTTKTPTTTVVEVKEDEEVVKKSSSMLVFFTPETVSYFIGELLPPFFGWVGDVFRFFVVRLLTNSDD